MGEMQDKSDARLLREYAEDRKQAAFRETVVRHADLVYWLALRQVGSPDLWRVSPDNLQCIQRLWIQDCKLSGLTPGRLQVEVPPNQFSKRVFGPGLGIGRSKSPSLVIANK